MHMPQNVLAETELKNLAAIPYQIISPAGNSPIIGIYQDSMLGSYRFTRPNVKMSPRDAMNLLMMYKKVDVNKIREKGDEITSFDILSQIIPPITLKYKTKLFEDGEDTNISNNVMEIRNGEYLRGQMEKSVLGSSTKGIIHRICNDFDNMTASNFIDDLQNVITEYMKTSSFSVGVSDLVADKKTTTEIIQVITDQKMEVQSVIDQVHLGVFKNNTAYSNNSEFETRVNNLLNKATEQSGKIGRKSLSKNNRFLMIVNSGSKGSLINISQMISCLGQQNVDGKRIPYGFDSRTLPHYSKFDDSPNARGFIENSYIAGLTAPELFFHAMGGRIGLIDTAVKSVTWDTHIVIIENNKPLYIEIGKWIDEKLEKTKENIQHFEEKNMELLNLKENVYIPTTDEYGNVTWGELTAVTRHDPSEKIYEIKTLGGRNVKVAESRSLLIWNKETKTFQEMNSPDVNIGDFVPVTVELSEPPVIKKHIDMSDYLLKTEYVYGTEFVKACNKMENDMNDRKKIPAGWWNDNNNNHFILPYTKKSSLQRTTIRSNIENIKIGYVYPYHSVRNNAKIPENFELNEKNGIFIGLFLAEGNIHKQHITITNNNENIRNFVKSWFDDYSIHFIENQKQNKIGGLTTTITGCSSVMANFITKLVGKGAENKHIPTESLIAPDEFIIGLLNGYYSGDGSISKNSIDVGSASSTLIEGISLLCSRLNIFGKVSKSQLKSNNLNTQNIKPTYRYRICSKWGKIFSEKINLIDENKQYKMKSLKWKSTIHRNFDTVNNVALDKIVEINILNSDKYPKLYDVTVPSTLNFCIANGLHCRDTSQTGYIQRRLIKGLEDLKVEYDMTVRNSKGKIIQFTYGDDGFDTSRVENQFISIVEMNIEDIYMHYDIVGLNDYDNDLLVIYSKGTVSRMKKQKQESKKKCKEYIDMMIEARDSIVEGLFKNKNENSIKIPVAFQHIILNIQGQLNLNSNSIVDITPLEAFELIEEYFEKINSIHFVEPTQLFKIMYFFYLTPKELVVNKRFHRKALTLLLETILLKYKQSIVHPGEMVGVIAGQSIGEPTTQLTLNSVTYETEIAVRNRDGYIRRVQIGDFVKEHVSKSKKIEYMKDKDTTYAELDENEEYYEISGASKEGETLWRRVEAVTKHPVINKDGTNTMLKFTTKGCREVIVTKAKSLLKLIDGSIQEAGGDDFKVGEYVIVSRKPYEYKETYHLDLKTILPPNKYIYGCEMEKAKQVCEEYHWWSNHNGKTFTLPYGRSDSAYCALNHGKGGRNYPRLSGFVYNKTMGKNESGGCLPDNIELNYDFGYLIGAYAAEGCMTKHQISISNNETAYFEPIIRFCNKMNITTKMYVHNNKINHGWTSSDIRLYNTLLCHLLEKLCGKLSHNKFVAPSIVFSNRECILGFLDAYISGDGYVEKNLNTISIHSVSLRLLQDVQMMLRNLNISSYIRKEKKQTKNNRGTLPENFQQPYKIYITNNQSVKLAKLLHLSIDSKQKRLGEIIQRKHRYEYSQFDDNVFPNYVNGKVTLEERNNRMMDLEFDKIISIEEVPNTTNYAYDLTVEDTRNFDCINGVNFSDTFHLSGVASKSNVTRGVPRIEEILRLTKNPKNPSLTVHLKPFDELDQEKATKFANMMEHTKLVDLVKSVQICFDPIENASFIEEDRTLLEQFYEFENIVEECMEIDESERNTIQKSKWIIRMELDPELLLDKNITMDDIHFAIKHSHYGNEINCVYSDYNMDKLVFRIRTNSNIFSKSKKKGVAESLDQSDEIYLLKNFQDTLLNNIVLRGINGIENVIPRKLQNMVVKDDGKYVRKDVWILDTTGSNLLDTLSLDFIDNTRTYSNDIKEIFNVLGIEAARQILYNEFVDVMEFSDVYINYHHLSLLCDRMTCTKDMVSIFRSGILNDDIGPISKSTFEVHTEVLLNAARHAEFDHMRGVSAAVMMGQYGYYGTNAFNLVLDIKEMEKLDVADVDISDKNSEIEKMFKLSGKDDDVCSRSNIEINNNIRNIKYNNHSFSFY